MVNEEFAKNKMYAGWVPRLRSVGQQLVRIQTSECDCVCQRMKCILCVNSSPQMRNLGPLCYSGNIITI